MMYRGYVSVGTVHDLRHGGAIKSIFSFFPLLIHLQSQISLINWVKTLVFCVTYIAYLKINRFGQVDISIQALLIEIYYYISNQWNFISNH